MSANLYRRGEIWWARFKIAGVEYRQSLRTRVRSEAERRLKLARRQVEDAAHFGVQPPTSWQAAVVSWNANATRDLGPKTLQRYLVSLKQLRTFLDGKMLDMIDVALVRDLVKARGRQGITTATLRRDLTAMSSVIEHAIEEGWMDGNPTLPIRRRRLREKHQPIALPQPAAIAAMLLASPTRFADAQEFALETGMRQEEIFSLTRSQLDVRNATITIFKGKGNKLRVLPYTRFAQSIVERQPAFLGSPFVFWHDEGIRWRAPGSRFTDVRRRVAQKAAQRGDAFEPYRFHDLRHLYAVEYLRQRTGSIYDLKALLGHESVKTTERYLAFLTPEEKKAAMHGVAQSGAREQRFASSD